VSDEEQMLVCAMDAKNIKEVTQTSSGTKTRPRPSSIFNAGSLHDPLPLLSLHQRSKTGGTTAEKMTTMRVFLQLTKASSSSSPCVCDIQRVHEYAWTVRSMVLYMHIGHYTNESRLDV
jgi:hypothetical protein